MAVNRFRNRMENRTLRAMISLYCQGHHTTAGALCSDCSALLEYANARVAACPWMPDKPACSQCPVHCYKPEKRAEIRTVMRYSGPKMLFRHPWLTFLHLLVKKKGAPLRKKTGCTV